MAPTLVDVQKTRKSLQRKLITLQATIVGYTATNIDIDSLELDATTLISYKKSGEDLYDATYALCPTDADFAADHEGDFNTILACIKTLQIKVNVLLRQLKGSTSATSLTSFKLERMKLPQFSGDYAEWQSFHDLFVASVEKNTSLSGAEKMVYVKSALTGDAATIVSSFQATEAHYKEAWDLVVKRFSNKREIVFAHIKKFDEFQPLKGESSSGLRLLADTVNEFVRSLKVLQVPVDTWDVIIVYHAVKKLDSESRKEWSLEQKVDFPKLDQLIDFLETRSRALSDANPASSKLSSTFDKKYRSSSSHHSSSSSPSCAQCSGSHHLHRCNDFASLSVSGRKSLIVKNNLCFNCMFGGHLAKQCKMQFSCKKCGQKHHSLLHEDRNSSSSVSSITSSELNSISVSATTTPKSDTVVLLATLMAQARDITGCNQVVRVFLDPGSESNFISEECCQRLGLKRKKTCVTVSGIGGVAGESAKGLVNLHLLSNSSPFTIDISALVYRKLTSHMLPRQTCKAFWPHLKGLQLADPNYYQPSRIDILLGAPAAGLIMLPGIIQGPENAPVAQLTKFGWILSGAVPTDTHSSTGLHSVSLSPAQVSSHHAFCGQAMKYSSSPAASTDPARRLQVRDYNFQNPNLRPGRFRFNALLVSPDTKAGRMLRFLS